MSRDSLIRLHDMLASASADQVPLHEWQRQLLEERLAAHRAATGFVAMRALHVRLLHGRSPRDTAFAMATFLLVAAIASIGCASHRHAGSPSAAARDDERVAILNIYPGEDRQARILSFDGVPFDAFTGRHAQAGHFRVPLRPGVHEVRVVVPGPCTYYDGHPGPGSSLSNMRFSAKAGTEYEVTMASFPSQLFTLTQVHVYEVVKAPYEFRAVEQATSYEADPSSCPNGRGIGR